MTNKKGKEKKFFYVVPAVHSIGSVHRHVIHGGNLEYEVSSLVDVTGPKDVYVTAVFGNRMGISVLFCLHQ